MAYHWKINEIKQLETFVKKCHPQNKTEIIMKKESLMFLKSMKKTLNNKSTFTTLKDNDHYHPISCHTYYDYMDVPEMIRKIVIKSTFSFFGMKDYYKEFNIPKTSLTLSELFSMSYDFFRWIPNKNYASLVKTYLDKNNHFFQVDSYKNRCYGEFFCIYYPIYKPFFRITKTNTFNDFLTINHELAHGLYFCFDPQNKTNSYIKEVEGVYFDLLSLLYLKEHHIVSSDVLYLLTKNLFLTNYESIINSFIFYTSLKTTIEKKHSNLYEAIIQKFMEKGIHPTLNQNELFEILTFDIKENFRYALSFFIGIDLISQNDIELSFHHFEKIRITRERNLLKNLRENQITFMDDSYQNLNTLIQKLHLRK